MCRLRLAGYWKQSGHAVAANLAGNKSPIKIGAILIAAITFATNAMGQAQDLDNGRTKFSRQDARGAMARMARAAAR